MKNEDLKSRNPVRRSGAKRFILAFFQSLLFILHSSIFCSIGHAKNGSEPLNHYALSALDEETAGARLAGRFKAKGQPVFLIHDPNRGLMPGDVMRFQDKAVLVDADVWQTLQAEGALEHLKTAPLVRVQAKASITAWESRARLVDSPRERKAYLVGAELLKILDQNFGGIPSRQQVSIAFDGPNLVLHAPSELLDQLVFTTVRKVTATGSPTFIVPPPRRAFLGRPFQWQAWAADPSEPSASLRYSLTGDLPKGLSWDATSHSLEGVPQAEGRFPLIAEARDPDGNYDTLRFVLEARQNGAPSLAHAPRPAAVADQPWEFRPEAVDPDHEGSQVRIEAVKTPQGMEFDSASGTFRWTPSPDLVGASMDLVLRLTDPDGGTREEAHAIKVVPSMDLLVTEGVKVNLPWDTLQQGREYTWQAGAATLAWAQQGATLVSITGAEETQFEAGTLRFRPLAAGFHDLDFTFEAAGQRSV
ncbi:MAG TPA: hypothetical protein VK465_11555, partial [Fibrobacteria bacterium]|nr:hypothetical protein [Fibrobacteria bacterium]